MADQPSVATFIVRDRDNPRCGWICYKNAEGFITPIDYVRLPQRRVEEEQS